MTESRVATRPATPYRLVVAMLVSLALWLAGTSAEATHRVDERFTVWGRVTYSDGAPAPDQTVVVVVAEGRDAARYRTGSDGWYRKVLAVGNADRGKVFDVKVRNLSKKVTVEFDPDDRVTERGQRVDFMILQ